MERADAPTRSSGKLVVGFGLVQIPLSVYTATEDRGVHRSRFSQAGNPIGLKNYDKETGEEVQFADIVTKYIKGDGTAVVLTDDEIAEAAGNANGVADIVAVLSTDLLWNYEQVDLFQVRPSKKDGPTIGKAFRLLMDALALEDKFVLLKFTMRGKTRIAALTPDGNLRVLSYQDELRALLPMPEATPTAQELELAKTLLEAFTTDIAPQISNDTAARVRAYAEAKAEGDAPAVKKTEAAPVSDLMAALTASIEAAGGKPKKAKAKKAAAS